MPSDIKLYDVFGELMYVLAKADGIVQPEEIAKMKELISDHPKAQEIIWSFDFEMTQNTDPEEVYKKVIRFCQDYGPDPEYKNMIDMMEEIAKSSDGVDLEEGMVMEGFFHELTDRFRKDIEALKQRGR